MVWFHVFRFLSVMKQSHIFTPILILEHFKQNRNALLKEKRFLLKYCQC